MSDPFRTYTRTDTARLAQVTEDNKIELARLIGGDISFDKDRNHDNGEITLSKGSKRLDSGTWIGENGFPVTDPVNAGWLEHPEGKCDR